MTNYEINFVGMVGEVSYRILGDVEPLAIKQINALADFALYCGVGRKTPMGMGMTRRIAIAPSQKITKQNAELSFPIQG
ncbi:MAG: CRISPR system precrRNA processing endoribonuclease RAMP protein Cas6 [Microcoleus sp.]